MRKTTRGVEKMTIKVIKPRILYNKYHPEHEEKPVVEPTTKTSEDYHGGDEITQSMQDQRFAQQTGKQQNETQQQSDQSQCNNTQLNVQQTNESNTQTEQQYVQQNGATEDNNETNQQQMQQNENLQNNETQQQNQNASQPDDKQTEQQNTNNDSQQNESQNNNENQQNNQSQNNNDSRQNQQTTEQQNDTQQTNESQQTNQQNETNQQQSEQQTNENQQIAEQQNETEDNNETDQQNNNSEQNDQQNKDESQNETDQQNNETQQTEQEEDETEEQTLDDSVSDDHHEQEEEDDYDEEQDDYYGDEEQEDTPEYNTQQAFKINEKHNIKRQLYLAFYRLVEYLSDEEKQPTLLPGQTLVLNVKKLMMRQYERKPLNAYYYYRTRSQVILILDNSGSMKWLMDELSTFFEAAVKRKDVQIYIAPNGYIEEYYNDKTKISEPIDHEDAIQQIIRSGLPVIYVGDFDGANTPIELSWTNRVYWICTETRYKYFTHYHWVGRCLKADLDGNCEEFRPYHENDFKGFFGRAFNDKEIITVLKEFAKNVYKQRFWYDKHDIEDFSEE